MIDLHTHILPETDDGSKNMEQSINMLKEAKNAGFNTVCCTPHYFENRFIKNKRENEDKISSLRAKAIEEKIDINIVLGNEIYINDKIIDNLDSKKISCIGNTKYLLIELPMTQEIKYLHEAFTEILEKGYKIIIAHPERYKYVQKNPNYFVDFINRGIYFQGNYASILGFYGREAKKTIKKLLKRNLIHILATDTHRDKTIYLEMDKINKKIKKIIGEKDFNIYTEENPKLVLNNSELITKEPKIKFLSKYY